MGIIGFGRFSWESRSRIPSPPQNSTTFIARLPPSDRLARAVHYVASSRLIAQHVGSLVVAAHIRARRAALGSELLLFRTSWVRGLGACPCFPRGVGPAWRPPPQRRVEPPLALQPLEVLDSDVCARERLPGQLVVAEGVVQLFHAAPHRPFGTEVGEGARQLAAVDAVTARIGPPTVRITHATAGDDFLDQIRESADAIVLFGAPHVERLVVH